MLLEEDLDMLGVHILLAWCQVEALVYQVTPLSFAGSGCHFSVLLDSQSCVSQAVWYFQEVAKIRLNV